MFFYIYANNISFQLKD